MNAVEIEVAISQLAEQPFDPEHFPYAFLEAFGNKETTIKRLRAGASNKSDLGGVLQTNNIHIKVCAEGEVTKTLTALRESASTTRAKAKFILATDGIDFEAEDLTIGETVACNYKDFPDRFGFFLPLAGISTVQQISENSFDIRATSRLNRLYVELLKDNPEWGTAARRHDMNHFMARLIFCFFAEDTDIFIGKGLFTDTIAQMSAKDSSNTHAIIETLFRAMNTKLEDRDREGVPRWANSFPYVNGGLFSGNMDVPRFSKFARSYLLHIGNLDWTKINPDIFGSMIQAVAEDEERGALGMHYTSVPNILKVLNPLFLDDLRAKLAEAGDNPRSLGNLRKRMAKIRVFDPACGSGNFLVIAYKQMREIEAEINRRRGESDIRSEIPLTNFRGIELRDFPSEIARLALVIAEYQCDVLYRGQKLALAEFLPLRSENWITCGNALRLDWLSICPPTVTTVKVQADDLFSTPLDQAEIDFENEGGETYICGNPPYVWTNDQSEDQKDDLRSLLGGVEKSWRSLNYVSGWFKKASDYLKTTAGQSAFVSINTICNGQHVAILWPHILTDGIAISFAYPSFKWSNLASNNAGVTVVIVGLAKRPRQRVLYQAEGNLRRDVNSINAYLIEFSDIIVKKASKQISEVPPMVRGNMPYDGGKLLLTRAEAEAEGLMRGSGRAFLKRLFGSTELLYSRERYCIWIDDGAVKEALACEPIRRRVKAVRSIRTGNSDPNVVKLAEKPHSFREHNRGKIITLVMPAVSSEKREFLPAAVLDSDSIISNRNYGIYDEGIWALALMLSTMHRVWVDTICGSLEKRFSYSNTLGWNTFPVPTLTDKNKADMTRCAEDILLAREHHFPATIADLYGLDAMPEDLRQAHERNDEVLERIYIGRRFKNDTERLEKLFDLYTKMTTSATAARQGKAKRRA